MVSSDRDAVSASKLRSDILVTKVQLLSDADGVAKASRPDVRPGQIRTVTDCNDVGSSSSDEIDMSSLEVRLESLMDESDDDDVMLTDGQLLHLAKSQPELLTKSQIEKVVRLIRPMTQSSDESETQSADDAETQSANADIWPETRSDDAPETDGHKDIEPQSADVCSETRSVDGEMSETQSVYDVKDKSLTRLDGNVVPWGDRDADDEIRWTDECSDDDETRSKSDDDGRATSDDAGSDGSDIKDDDGLARYYTANQMSDERRDDSATGRHDVMTVRRCYSMTAAMRRVRQGSARGGACMGHGQHRHVRVRGSTGVIINGKAVVPAW